jgi:myo-inositol-1(or 4)-monophosphatase
MPIKNTYLSHARVLAQKAGEILLDGRPDSARNSTLETSFKSSPTDLVTAKDLASENAIVTGILEKFPDDGIVGEEGTNRPTTSGIQWIIDPLDGTINYIYGSAFWSISIAVADAKGVFAGVVYMPLLDLEFYAFRGEGAYRKDRFGEVKLPNIMETEIENALCATGFAYKADVRIEQGNQLLSILPKIRDIRRVGTAAFDLCMVASGNVNAYFERTAQIWDIAAGALMVEEVGGVVSGLFGKPPGPDFTIAGPAKLQSEIVAHFQNFNSQSA